MTIFGLDTFFFNLRLTAKRSQTGTFFYFQKNIRIPTFSYHFVRVLFAFVFL